MCRWHTESTVYIASTVNTRTVTKRTPDNTIYTHAVRSTLRVVFLYRVKLFLLCYSSKVVPPPVRSLMAGVLWMVYDGQFNLRHTCEHSDGLQRYGWIRHDGTSFGQQEILDNGGCGFQSSLALPLQVLILNSAGHITLLEH